MWCSTDLYCTHVYMFNEIIDIILLLHAHNTHSGVQNWKSETNQTNSKSN